MAMRATCLIAECLTVIWFVAISPLTQVSGFSTIESEISATGGIASGIALDEKELRQAIKPTGDIYWPEHAGFDPDVFSAELKLLPTSPENINFTGGLDDQSWLIRNDLCPIFDPTDFSRQEKVPFPESH